MKKFVQLTEEGEILDFFRLGAMLVDKREGFQRVKTTLLIDPDGGFGKLAVGEKKQITGHSYLIRVF